MTILGMSLIVSAVVFSVIGMIMGISARRDAKRLLEGVKKPEVNGLLTMGGSPYRAIPADVTLAPGGPVPDAADEDATRIMSTLESRPWTRTRKARDNDNRPPWNYSYHCGKFTLSTDSELLMDDTLIGVPKSWVKAMRAQIEDEMAGRHTGPTRRKLLAAAVAEVNQIKATVETETMHD